MNISTILKVCTLILCLTMINFNAYGNSNPSEKEKEKNPQKKKKRSSEIAIQIKELTDLCEHELESNNDKKFDSIARLSLDLAESSFDPDLILETNLKYLGYVKERGERLQIKKIITRTEGLALKEQSIKERINTWLIIAESTANLGMSEDTYKFASKALNEAIVERNNDYIIKAYLLLGKSLELHSHYIEAYQNYLNALYQTELIKHEDHYDDKLNLCYGYLFDFFNSIKEFEKAAEYKNKEIEYYLDKDQIDSTKLMKAKYDLCGIAIRAKMYANISKKLTQILDFADKSKNTELKDYALSLYRTFLIETNNHKGFKDLYVDKYPEELDVLKQKNRILYMRILAKISEYEGKMQEAKKRYQKAEQLFTINHSPIFKSNFYKRYGQFLKRKGDLKEAKEMFLKSYKFAKEGEYLDYMLESSYYIDSISVELNNYKDAYKYSKINKELIEKENKLVREKEFLRIEIENESKQMALTQEKKEIETKRKYYIQYMILTIVIVLFFLLLILLSSMKVPEWVIQGLGFVSILMIFEFVILILDHKIHHLTHGAPLWIFIIKILILFVLFPLHHLVEKWIIKYMTTNQILKKPNTKSLKEIAHNLWPWLKNKEETP